jgi:hypothetical protein
MTLQEIHQLKIGDYGEISMLNKAGYHVVCTGTIIFISKKGTVTFYENDKTEYHKKPEEIRGFTPKEMLPPPVMYKGKKLTFNGGIWIDEGGKEIDIKR